MDQTDSKKMQIQCVSVELGDITGFYMIDEEGVLQSVDVGE